MHMKASSMYGLVVMAGLVLGGSTAVAFADSGPDYPTNSAGETLGSELSAATPADAPDLISAWATNGKLGYVRNADLNPEDPTSVAEALAEQPALLGKTRTIPVYEEDGATKIGELVVAPPKPPVTK